jgi:hypothetical protein
MDRFDKFVWWWYAEDVAKLNGHIILKAHRQVYARDDTFEYLLTHNNGVWRGSDLLKDDLAQTIARGERAGGAQFTYDIPG